VTQLVLMMDVCKLETHTTYTEYKDNYHMLLLYYRNFTYLVCCLKFSSVFYIHVTCMYLSTFITTIALWMHKIPLCSKQKILNQNRGNRMLRYNKSFYNLLLWLQIITTLHQDTFTVSFCPLLISISLYYINHVID